MTSKEIRQKLPGSLEVTIIRNKIDLSGTAASMKDDEHEIALSAKSGEGVELLRDHLKKIMGYTGLTE